MRTAAEPEGKLTSFLDFVYGACGNAAGWDQQQFTYARPPLRQAPLAVLWAAQHPKAYRTLSFPY